ncbi:MAG TPA: hypothetical protein VFK05_00390 [Polyangiaceae bacterium]|nr:hypothetical protein [Polyangiaceae bacterium]
MAITLDLNSSWTDADVATLIASVADDRDWRLEVSKLGIAFLHDMSDPTGEEYDDSLHCYFELWTGGSDFVGAAAAKDKTFVAKLVRALRQNYPQLQHGQFVFVAT